MTFVLKSWINPPIFHALLCFSIEYTTRDFTFYLLFPILFLCIPLYMHSFTCCSITLLCQLNIFYLPVSSFQCILYVSQYRRGLTCYPHMRFLHELLKTEVTQSHFPHLMLPCQQFGHSTGVLWVLSATTAMQVLRVT